MRLRRKRAPLAGLEVHRIVANPANVACAMVLKYSLAPLAQKGKIDSETRVGRFRTCDRLKEQIDGCAPVQASQLGCDMRQTARLGWNFERRDQPF